MPLPTSVRGACAVLAAVALSGCVIPTEPSHGLDVSVAVSSDVIRPGERIEVTVTAVNRGTRPVTIDRNPCSAAYGIFVVTTTGGELVAPGDYVCLLIAIKEVVAPGLQVVIQATWHGDSQRGKIGGPPVFLDAGEYWLRGQILAGSRRVRSAPVAIKVEP